MRTVTRNRGTVRLVAVLAIVVGVVAATSGIVGAVGGTDTRASAATTFFPRTAKQAAFQDEMRKLWEDHVTWTRLTIVSAVGGTNGEALPDLTDTVARLQANQDDLGAAIVPFFGQAAGARLATLLHEHISLAVALVGAAKDGDDVGTLSDLWYKNGQAIADFLAAANPRFWPHSAMSTAMKMHLDQTLAEAVARLQGRYGDEIEAYEEAHLHILTMADLLSSGIIRAFPEKFA